MKNKKFIITITCFLVAQAFMYWFLKYFETNFHYINFYLDNKISVLEPFVYIYNSFYPFTILVFYFIYKNDEDRYVNTIIAGTIGFLICDLIFLLYPTAMIHNYIPSHTLTGFILKLTYYFDEPALNCFPSIHCLFAFQTILSALLTKGINWKWKLLIFFYGLLIVVSTLFIKQHYIYDIFGALAVCLFSNFIVYIFRKFKFKKA